MAAVDYAGARGRIALGDVAELGARWVVQPKVDGIYARVHLDGRGRIAHLLTRGRRSWRPLPDRMARDILGALVGDPHAELVGEFEVWTEAANRAAAIAGYRKLHLFDVIRDGRRYLGRAPYRERLAALQDMRDRALELGERGRWQLDEHGTRDVESGRWSRAVLGPGALERVPVVPQLPARYAEAAWADWGPDAGGEGLVVVNLEAAIGARGSKRKCKLTETLDCRVVSVGAGAAVVEAGTLRFAVAAGGRRDRELEPGDVVEVAHEGAYSSGVPRFPRILRLREDLGATLLA